MYQIISRLAQTGLLISTSLLGFNLSAQESEQPPQSLSAKAKPPGERRNSEAGDLAEKSSSTKFSLGLGYLPASKISWSKFEVSDGNGSTSGSSSAELSGSPAFKAEFRFLNHNNWGTALGLRYSHGRKFDSHDIEAGRSYISYSLNNIGHGKFNEFLVSGDVLYSQNDFFLKFGLNYNFIDLKYTSVLIEDVEGEGGLGYQVGMGWELSQHLGIDLTYEVAKLRMKAKSNGVKYEFGEAGIRQFFLGVHINL